MTDYPEHKALPYDFKDIGDGGTFAGYTAVYNSVDRGGDIILPGAFTKSLESKRASGSTVKMLWQHDPSKVIGVWDSFSDDGKGLFGNGRLIKEVQQAREAHALMAAKAMDGLSIGYIVKDYDMQEHERGMVRVLKELDLMEVSVVTFPMNTEAMVTDVKQLQSISDVERILKTAGVPNTFAKMVAAHGFVEAQKRLAGDHREGDEDEATTTALTGLISELQGLKGIINAKG